ncbi:MAG: 2-oxo acid dehydrogenase subunit E2 [Candidatus Eremiobacteraeota bacterium]|nr:2-oxo acid dehydrogenase subunit E2 [Candidatus Eremiobacteraeota bacterium]
MPTTITMPQLGETVTEGTVAQWLKKPGDAIEKYEAFVEVSTDKVNAEVPAPVTGVLREIIVKEGETVPTGAPIAIIDEVGAWSEPGVAHTAPESATPDPATPKPSPAPVATQPQPPAKGTGNGVTRADGVGERLRGVSPAVRRLAREHNVDLSRVRGTGANGRITAKDVVGAAGAMGPAAVVGVATTLEVPPAPAVPAPSGKTSYTNPIPGTTIPLTQARRIIAQRMVESKHTAPHAWTMVEVDVTNLWKWRTREKDAFERDYGAKLTLLPFFIRAVVESLARFPLMNASFSDEGIRVHKEVNVALAVALADNLILPVIRATDTLSVKGIALAAGALIDKARRGKLGADDLAGATFTVNNTGANGSILSAPIIPPGQTGIVTTEAVVKRPVVRPSSELGAGSEDVIAIRSMMNVCLSLDHRVVDGSIASGFLSDLKARLEKMGPSGSL